MADERGKCEVGGGDGSAENALFGGTVSWRQKAPSHRRGRLYVHFYPRRFTQTRTANKNAGGGNLVEEGQEAGSSK